MNADTIIANFKSQISEIIKEQTLTTLTRLRSKIFIAVNMDDDFEIDMEKFAENTLKKIMEESVSVFSEVEEGIKKAAEKVPKLKKDPDAPKAAVNAYILFSRDNRDDVKSENPELKTTEITKKLAEMWKSSDEDLKKEYKEKSEQDKERYAKELETYVPKDGFQNPKEKKTKSKKSKKTGPKKPLNAYMWFCSDKREELKGKGFSNTEILRELGRLWKELSDKKKKPYVKKAEEDKERYQDEMKDYVPTEEEKAEKKGKAKKTSDGPKRPIGAFMLFRKDKYQKVKEENPEMKMTDISKKIGDMWKNLSKNEKKKYTDKAAKLLAEFKEKNSADKVDIVDNEDEKNSESEIENDDEDEKNSESEIENDDEDEKNSESEIENEEDDEELDIPSTGTPTKCMPIIISDAKFAKMKEEEAEKKKAEKKAEKEEKKKDKKKEDKEEKKKEDKEEKKKYKKEEKKKEDKKEKKNKKSVDTDDEEILSDSD